MKKDALKVVLVFVIALVLAFTLLAVFACCFDRVGVASAEEVTLPSNGIIGSNLLSNSDLSVSTNYTSFFSYTGGVSFDSSNDCTVLTATSSTAQWQSYLSNSVDLQIRGVPVVLSLYTNLGLYTLNVTNITNTNYASSFITLSNGWGIRFRRGGVDQVLFIQILRDNATSDTLSIYWFKLELGSSFTGFVPNSYSNYGYNQGYSSGVLKGEDNVQRYNNGVVVAGDLVVPNSTNYPNVTLTDGQVGAGGFRYSGTGDATTTAFGLEVFSSTTASTLEPVAINYGGNLSTIFNIAILIRSGQTTSFTVSVAYGSSTYVHLFSSINENYLFLIQLDIPFNVIPTSRLIITFPSNSVATLVRYETVRSDYFTSFSSGGDFQDGYTTGYSAGLAESITNAFDQGYNEGYDVGYDEGYDTGAVVVGDYRYAEGYSDGIRTADEGTWFSFVSAFIDVPITVITSYLDFDILGLNLLKFVKACVSFMLFFAVLKLLIGKVK